MTNKNNLERLVQDIKAWILCEHHGDKPRSEDMHIRRNPSRVAYVGGRESTALCGAHGMMVDHPIPRVEDLPPNMKMCSACREIYNEENT